MCGTVESSVDGCTAHHGKQETGQWNALALRLPAAREKMQYSLSLVPKPLPDIISQLWGKLGFSPQHT